MSSYAKMYRLQKADQQSDVVWQLAEQPESRLNSEDSFNVEIR